MLSCCGRCAFFVAELHRGLRCLAAALSSQAKSLGSRLETEIERQSPAGSLTGKKMAEGLIAATIECHARSEMSRHAQRKEAVAHSLVHPEAFKLMTVVNEAESVAIGKGGRTSQIEAVTAQFFHLSNKLSESFRRVGREDARLSPFKEVSGIAAVESLVQIRLKGCPHFPV